MQRSQIVLVHCLEFTGSLQCFAGGAELRELETVFGSLVQQIQNYDDGEISSNRYDKYTALQGNFFNMLELATYFTGYPYNGLEGKGRLEHEGYAEGNPSSMKTLDVCISPRGNCAPYSDLASKMEDWRLVGTIPGLASTSYPGEMALEELEDRMEKGELKPPCISFRISDDHKIHHWNFNLVKNKNGEFKWIKVRSNAKHLLFLTAICYHRDARSRGSLLSRLFNDDSLTADRKFCKWKQRCSEEITGGLISTGTNINPLDNTRIFLDDTGTDRPVPEFQPELSVLGAMDNNITWY